MRETRWATLGTRSLASHDIDEIAAHHRAAQEIAVSCRTARTVGGVDDCQARNRVGIAAPRQARRLQLVRRERIEPIGRTATRISLDRAPCGQSLVLERSITRDCSREGSFCRIPTDAGID